MNQFSIHQKVTFFSYTQGNMSGTITEVLPAGLYKVKFDGEENESVINGNDLIPIK